MTSSSFRRNLRPIVSPGSHCLWSSKKRWPNGAEGVDVLVEPLLLPFELHQVKEVVDNFATFSVSRSGRGPRMGPRRRTFSPLSFMVGSFAISAALSIKIIDPPSVLDEALQ